MVDSKENYKFGLGVKELVQSLIAWLQGPNQQKEKQNIFGCQPFWVCKRLMKHRTIQIEKSKDNISKPKQSTDLSSPRVPYGTGCHYMPNIYSFFWNFHNQRVIERSAHWRHKIMAPSNTRLGLPPLQLLELFVFVLFWFRWYVTTINALRAAI